MKKTLLIHKFAEDYNIGWAVCLYILSFVVCCYKFPVNSIPQQSWAEGLRSFCSFHFVQLTRVFKGFVLYGRMNLSLTLCIIENTSLHLTFSFYYLFSEFVWNVIILKITQKPVLQYVTVYWITLFWVNDRQCWEDSVNLHI